MLFPLPLRELPDAEAETLLREAMTASATGLARVADTYLAAQCARVLIDRLRLSGVGFYVACESTTREPHT